MEKLPFVLYAHAVLAKANMGQIEFPQAPGIRIIKIPHNADLESLVSVSGKSNIVFYKELEPASKNYFLRLNFENYMKDPRPGNMLVFNDLEILKWMGRHTGMRIVRTNKHQVTTQKKLLKLFETMIDISKKGSCCVCLENVPREQLRACGRCHSTMCFKCSCKWEKQKGVDYSCPTCRHKGYKVRMYVD